MNNFLEFINTDIEGKREFIASLPTKTKINRRKLNQTLDMFLEKYNEYSDNLLKYINAKAKSIVKLEDKDYTSYNDKIKKLEHVKFLMNPINTYLEKMGFDTLLYKINNYDTLNFKSLNTIINSLLDKFEEAGIKLKATDFDYTSYVQEYMTSFLEVRETNSNDYTNVGQIFERIYWLNPELIDHIHLNFRKLIRNNSKKFIDHVEAIAEIERHSNGITDYKDCLEKINEAYLELEEVTKEDVVDITKLSVDGNIIIDHYFPYNKVRLVAYQSLLSQTIDVDDKARMKKVCSNLEKLKHNVLELSGYLKFLPMVDDFKNTYSKLLDESDANKKLLKKSLTDLENDIIKKEKELDKINSKVRTGRNLIIKLSEVDLKNLKVESVNLAKELSSMYKKYDDEYFKIKVVDNISKNLTISDLLELYYSFDYFQKTAIQRVFNLESYDDVMSYSAEYDSYVVNPLYMICRGILLFGDDNVEQVICNKYKLCGIMITEEDLTEENIESLLDKINLILRVNIIENSDISVEQISFITKANKYKKNKEEKKA